MENLFNEELMAIVPQYIEERGNCTVLYTKGSQPVVINKSIKTVIRLIGKHYMIDLNESRKRYSSLMSSSILVPIALSKKDVFVPFKTRVPMYKNDGAFAYINMNYIQKVRKSKNSTTVIHLVNGTTIECISCLTTVDNHMRNGNIMSRCYEERSMQVSEDGEKYMNSITTEFFRMLLKGNGMSSN